MSNPARESFRTGAVGALMDEFERATEELGRLIEEITDSEFQTVVDSGAEEEELHTIQGVANHVVRAGYAHANHVRGSLSVPWSRVEVSLGTRSESLDQLETMVGYMASTLDGRWDMVDKEIEAVEIKARWGTTYDLEQMLEHAVVHVLRHRRQIERFLWKARSGDLEAPDSTVAVDATTRRR